MQGVHCEALANPVWLEKVPEGQFVGVCVPGNKTTCSVNQRKLCLTSLSKSFR